MASASILGSIMWEAINEGHERTLQPDEVNNFYISFQAEVSEKIEVIRTEQRRAYEEGKSLILS